MKILKLEESKGQDGVIVKAWLDKNEFQRLNGYLDKLVVFSAKAIDESSKAIKTGARNSYARYFLLPVQIRKRFKTDTHDFEHIMCGALECNECLYVIYCIGKKCLGMGEGEKDNE